MTRFITLIFVLLVGTVSAQDKYLERILNEAPQQVEKLPIKKAETTAYIPADFAAANLKELDQVKALKLEAVTSIQLVYTQYRLAHDFDQHQLNYNRLRNLQRQAPDWFVSPLIKWSVVEQTGCENPESGADYFHGFVVTYKATSGEAQLKKDIDLLNATFELLTADPSNASNTQNPGITGSSSDPTTPNNQSDQKSQKINRTAKMVTDKPKDFSVTSKDDPADQNLQSYVIKTRWDDKWGFIHDTIWGDKITPTYDFKNLSQDSAVIAVLNRNDFENRLFVVDVTCSMSPFTAQVLLWFKLQAFQEQPEGDQHFVFFNDGDGKSTRQKKQGETGGIYTLTNPDLAEIHKTMVKATKKCASNDALENDTEALIRAQKLCPDCTEIILIADNFSNIRDKDLIPTLYMPVRAILCGATEGVNPQYLELARKTDGSVHTVVQDVPGVFDLVEDDIVNIHGVNYQLKSGKFLPLYSW